MSVQSELDNLRSKAASEMSTLQVRFESVQLQLSQREGQFGDCTLQKEEALKQIKELESDNQSQLKETESLQAQVNSLTKKHHQERGEGRRLLTDLHDKVW